MVRKNGQKVPKSLPPTACNFPWSKMAHAWPGRRHAGLLGQAGQREGSLVNNSILFSGIISSRPLGPAQLPLQGFTVGLQLQYPGLQCSQLLCMGALHCCQHCVFLPGFTVKLFVSGTQGRAPPGFTQCPGVSKCLPSVLTL